MVSKTIAYTLVSISTLLGCTNDDKQEVSTKPVATVYLSYDPIVKFDVVYYREPTSGFPFWTLKTTDGKTYMATGNVYVLINH